MAGGCKDALRALEPVKTGASADAIGAPMAEAIGRCGCALADLDGFVSLFAWLTLPMPEVGWLPLDDAAR